MLTNTSVDWKNKNEYKEAGNGREWSGIVCLKAFWTEALAEQKFPFPQGRECFSINKYIHSCTKCYKTFLEKI